MLTYYKLPFAQGTSQRKNTRMFWLAAFVLGFVPLAHAKINGASFINALSIPPAEQAALRSTPLSLLAKFPEGGVAMARYVAQAVANDPRVVPPMLSIIKDTSPAQAAAIGTGFARGTRAINMKKPKTARTIIDQVMQSNNPQLQSTFRALGLSESGANALVALQPIPTPPFYNAPSQYDITTDVRSFEPSVTSSSVILQDYAVNIRAIEAAELIDAQPNNEVINTPDRVISTYVLAQDLSVDAAASGAVSTSPSQ